MPPLHVIAKRAGVSIATVSRVLNKHPSVRPRTAEHVHQAISEITEDSRQVRTNGEAATDRREVAMYLFGVTLANLNPIFAELVSGVVEELRSRDMRMIFSEVGSIAEFENDPRRDELAGGVVLAHPSLWNSPEMKRMAELVPTVWVMGPNTPVSTLDHVVPDNWAVGQIAFDYLRKIGCPAVSYMALPVWYKTITRVQMIRPSAFSHSATAAQIPSALFISDDDVVARRVLASDAVAGGSPAELVKQFVKTQPRGSGLFVGTDREAAMVYPMLVQNGFTPGKDVFVIACDNEVPTLAPLEPRPATIDIRARDIGRQAVRRLMHRIDHPNDSPIVIHLPPILVPPI